MSNKQDEFLSPTNDENQRAFYCNQERREHMKLKAITIKNFRNVKSISLENLDANKGTIITAKNMTGKTNTLNAIHWAFTGSLLDGSSNVRSIFTKDDEQVG